MGKVKFFEEKHYFFFKVLVEGLNNIQFYKSKNEGNPKLLVYFMTRLIRGFPSQR